VKQLKPRIDPDEIDLEQLLATVETPGWRMIATRMAEAHNRELKKLAIADTWDNTRFIQGVLAGIQAAGEIPKILETEIRGRSARKRGAQH
jgi:hypothetical protein